MSKELTEQWRNGTLKRGDYYITTKGLGIDDVLIGFYEGELQQFDGFCDCSIKEVLAHVPDYDQFSQLVKKVEQMEKQLEIATKALKHMAKFPAYYHDYTGPAAQQALKEMEGVK